MELAAILRAATNGPARSGPMINSDALLRMRSEITSQPLRMTASIVSRPLGIGMRNARRSVGAALNLNLGAEFHHLLGRHPEERGGAFGVALQEGEHVFAPQPHARNVLARN